MANLGGPFPTPAPDYTEAADILRALRLYHYGTETIPATEADVDPASMAGYIKNVLDRIDAVEQGVAAISNLTTAQNLNDLAETKVWHALPTITAQQQADLNYPTTTTGILVVYVANATKYQFYQTAASGTSAEVYFRATAYGTNTFSDWQQVSKVGHTHNTLYYTINQINAKVDSTIGTTAAQNKALVTDNNGKIVPSASITTTELNFLDGVTENVQNQINNHTHDTRYYQRSETARVFVQSTQPTGAQNGDLWFY